ncbi:MAG: 2-phosphosulfolactate phosphatase, partial [Planctomycetaceae bacterium]
MSRKLHVHLLPDLCAPEALRGGVAVVIDVLRASTTIVHALAAGATAVYPCASVGDARRLAERLDGAETVRRTANPSAGVGQAFQPVAEEELRPEHRADKDVCPTGLGRTASRSYGVGQAFQPAAEEELRPEHRADKDVCPTGLGRTANPSAGVGQAFQPAAEEELRPEHRADKDVCPTGLGRTASRSYGVGQAFQPAAEEELRPEHRADKDVCPTGLGRTASPSYDVAASADVETILLGGERLGVAIEGFDLDNSPASYSPARVAGRTIVFTTTNGTRAIERARQADRILIGAFSNRAALVEALVDEHRPVHFLCAGTDGQVTAEDVLAAGMLVTSLAERIPTATRTEPGG